MAVQVYNSDSNFLFEFSENNEIEQAFDELFKRTGIYVDVYGGTTRLYKNHAQILVDFLDKRGNQITKMAKDFKDNLSATLKKDEMLYVIGD